MPALLKLFSLSRGLFTAKNVLGTTLAVSAVVGTKDITESLDNTINKVFDSKYLILAIVLAYTMRRY
jgi:hypothetical protein